MKPAIVDLRSELVRSALSEIARHNGDYLEPSHVVSAAREPSHPLHHEFEWDDSVAGDAYRIAQAATLIRRVKFTITRSDSEGRVVTMRAVRQFEAVERAKTGSSYEAVPAIMDSLEKKAKLLENALRELNGMRKRYEALQELSSVWAAVDSLQAR